LVRGPAAIALVVGTVVSGLSVASAPIGADARHSLNETFLPRGGLDRRLVVIGFDRTTSRSTRPSRGSAQGDYSDVTNANALVGILRGAGAKAIGFVDLQPGRFPLKVDRDAFAQTIRRVGDVVLPLNALSVERTSADKPLRAVAYEVDALSGAAGLVGAGWPGEAATERGRFAPLVVSVADLSPGVHVLGETRATSWLPSIGLATFLRGLGVPVSVAPAKGGLRAGGAIIPTERNLSMRVSYTRELLSNKGSAVVNAYDVLGGRFDRGRFEGSTVLVGVTDPREAPLVAVPTGTGRHEVPEVLFHANVVNTLLSGDFVRPAPSASRIIVSGVLAGGVALAGLAFPLAVLPLVMLALVGGWLLVAAISFGRGTILDLSHPTTAVVLGGVVALTVRGVRELRRRRQVTELFSRYAPREVVDRLIAEGRAEAASSGERLDVSLLFCDIRGFTPIAAGLSPTDVRRLLTIFYGWAADAIMSQRGTVLQYVGDEVLAVFGAPLPRDDHADAALACAADMQSTAAALNEKLQAELLPGLSFGIGVHTGEVVAANVGSEHHQQYAVIGEAVNVGSRLCSIARDGRAVVSEATLFRCSMPQRLTRLGPTTLKGVADPITCFALE
jgi:adenylate cyclase